MVYLTMAKLTILKLVIDALPSSLIDSNVNLRSKQRKDKELGHVPGFATFQG
jgi:hypothetical protein